MAVGGEGLAGAQGGICSRSSPQARHSRCGGMRRNARRKVPAQAGTWWRNPRSGRRGCRKGSDGNVP